MAAFSSAVRQRPTRLESRPELGLRSSTPPPRSSTPERWHHADHLGSTSVLTDETGTTVGTATYDPYGATAKTTGETSRLGFAGEYADPGTGFIYLQRKAPWFRSPTGRD